MSLIALLALCLAPPTSPTELDVLSRVFNNARLPYRDVSFEFRGCNGYNPPDDDRPTLDPTSANMTFAGVFVQADRKTAFVDLFQRQRGQPRIFRETRVIANGSILIFQGTENQYDHVKPRNAVVGDLENVGLPGRFLTDYDLEWLLHDPFFKLTSQSDEVIDGRPCKHLAFVFGDQPRPNVMHYWIDLERGANTLRMDMVTADGELLSRVHRVKLETFKTKRGETIWFPTYARYDTFIAEENKVIVFKTKPQFSEDYQVVRETVLFNDESNHRPFKIKNNAFPNLSAELKAMAAEFAAPPPPAKPFTMADARERLEAELRSERVASNELRATSSRESRSSLLSWLPWMTAAGSGLGCCGLVVMRVRSNLGR